MAEQVVTDMLAGKDLLDSCQSKSASSVGGKHEKK
jgi:hypothetical protein